MVGHLERLGMCESRSSQCRLTQSSESSNINSLLGPTSEIKTAQNYRASAKFWYDETRQSDMTLGLTEGKFSLK